VIFKGIQIRMFSGIWWQLRGPILSPIPLIGVSSPMSVLPDLMVFSVQIVQYNYKNVTRT
jgi:hypothetical protein